MKCFTYT